MEGLKEALQYIVGLKEPTLTEINGEQYSDKSLYRILTNPKADAIELNTLSSLVDYIKSEVDVLPPKMIVHVQSPTQVSLYSCLDKERTRENVVSVVAKVPYFPFGRFIEREEFTINVQSKFIGENDLDLPNVSESILKDNAKSVVLKFIGTVENGTVAKYGDDGVSQKATIQQSVASKEIALVPNPVRLIPYRTFTEVPQPASDFIFRIKDDHGGVSAALFEADGGAWENAAKQTIKDYLETELQDIISDSTVLNTKFIIIS